MEELNSSTLFFLQKLANNNNRDWFNKHKDLYLNEKENTTSFFNEVKLNLTAHDKIEKMKLFRIYRDVRFSADKTPYKPRFAAHFVRATKELRGGYYLHIEPKNSFLAGGFWKPNKEDLFRIRKEFEFDDDEIKQILNGKKFLQNFGNIEGESVKTAPRGFNKNHKAIDLIRMKQFVVTKKFSNNEVLSSDFLPNIDSSFKTMRPFLDYMSYVLTTNLNGESILD